MQGRVTYVISNKQTNKQQQTQRNSKKLQISIIAKSALGMTELVKTSSKHDYKNSQTFYKFKIKKHGKRRVLWTKGTLKSMILSW